MQRACPNHHRIDLVLRNDQQGLCFRLAFFVLTAVLIALLCRSGSICFAGEDEPEEALDETPGDIIGTQGQLEAERPPEALPQHIDETIEEPDLPENLAESDLFDGD